MDSSNPLDTEGHAPSDLGILPANRPATQDLPESAPPDPTTPGDDRPRRDAGPDHDQSTGHTALGRAPSIWPVASELALEPAGTEQGPEAKPDDLPRLGAAEHNERGRQTTIGHDRPEGLELVTVEEAVTLFGDGGLPRHIRTIQKYCARRTGRSLVCHQIPTENGIRYLIEKASIDRFIAAAALQAPIGKLEAVQPVRSLPESVDKSQTFPPLSDMAIFDHPYVQRLETRIDSLETKNDRLQGEVKTVLEAANERLIELQKANAVAQSETLGTFLLEAERLRKDSGPVNDPSATVDSRDWEEPGTGV
jgi:hypothetical protein